MSATSFSAETGRSQFLQLFVTQLQHQDPLEPVKQEDFLQQLAQFSTVEGLEKLNTKFDRLVALQEAGSDLPAVQALGSAAGLLGTTVSYTDDSLTRTGLVTEIKQKSGQVLLQVGGSLIPVSDVTSVR